MTLSAADRLLLYRARETLRGGVGSANASRVLDVIRNRPWGYWEWCNEHVRDFGKDRLLSETERGDSHKQASLRLAWA